MIDERIAERRAQVRDQDRRRRLRRTIVLVVLVLLVVTLVLVERSALVALEEVEVVGTQRLQADDVRDAAGLELGTSTVRLRLRAASERVEALPLVRTATARRIDPLTVRIEVQEREPALNARGEDHARLVDRDGVVLMDGELEELPTIDLPAEPPPPGGTVVDDPALGNAHRAWRGLSGPLRSEVVSYRAAGPDELSLLLRSGVEVRFGRAERIEEKVRALGAVLDDLDGTPVEVIDVRAPSAPVVIPVD